MKKKLKFEEALQRLEEITRQLSEGCELDEALKLYAEGAELIRSGSQQLDEARLKIETLFPRDVLGEDEDE